MTTALRGRRGLIATLALAGLSASVIACGGGPQAAPSGTPAATIQLAADNLEFDQEVLTVPAGSPFAIRFENREAPPHNVSIHGDSPLFVGETFSGPDERLYQVPALAAGEYTFLCDVHPDMRGTVVSE